MKRSIICCISIYALIAFFAAEKSVAALKFGIHASHNPPLLYQFEDPNFSVATGGLIYEITVAIADDLDQEYSISALPESRMIRDLKHGHLDLSCYISPEWDRESKEDFLWSNPLYAYANVLVSQKEIQQKSIDQLPFSKVGTVGNYFYHELENKFKNNSLQRDDSGSVLGSLKKLLDNRLDYVVMTEIEFSLYKRTYPQLQKSSFTVDKTDIFCALSKKSSLSLQRLNKTIANLQAKNVFKKTYARYSNLKTAPRPIAYGMNDSNSPPFLQIDNSTSTPVIQGGLFFDLALEIGKKLKRPIQFILSPRKRLDSGLASGEIELVCYNTEAWAGSYAKDYFWSIPIFRQANYIVGLKKNMKNAQIKSLKDLKGKTLGTALGFVYPALIPYFENGSIKREDTLSGLANISKLHTERVQYIVLNNLEYNFYKKTDVNLQEAPFEIDPISVKCASSKKSDLNISDINAAVTALKKTGRLQKVFLPH